jgi:hypothetical protein
LASLTIVNIKKNQENFKSNLDCLASNFKGQSHENVCENIAVDYSLGLK